MKKKSLFEYMFTRLIVALSIVAIAFYLAFLAYSSSRMRREMDRYLSMTGRTVDAIIHSYLSSSAGYEIFFEQALEHLFEKIGSEEIDPGSIIEIVESYLDSFKPKLLEEELFDKDFVVFRLDGTIIHPGEYEISELDPYTFEVLEKLGIGDYIFERLDDVYVLKGEELFVKIGYMRIDEDTFLSVRLFLKWPGLKEIIESISSALRDIDVLKSINVYSHSLEPLTPIFEKSDPELKGLMEKALESMKPIRIGRGKEIVQIVPMKLPTIHEKQFAKPIVYTVVLDISSFSDWYRAGLSFSLLLIALSLVAMIVVIRKIVSDISKGFERLVGMMERFRSEKVFVEDVAGQSSKISEVDRLVRIFQEMAEDITAYVQELTAMTQELESSYRELERANRELEEAHLMFGKQLSMIAEGYDENTGNHITRVGELSAYFAEKLGMDGKFVVKIKHYAPLHDIGKLLVPRDILLKKGRLTDEEFEIMKKHTIYGALLLEDLPRFEMAKNIALYHHEKYSGRGYPYGLRGDEIPIEAQIVSLVDVYDALRSERPYKRAFTHEEALRIILEGDGRTQPEDFNPDLIEILKKFSDEIERLWEEVRKVGTPLEEKMRKIILYMKRGGKGN